MKQAKASVAEAEALLRWLHAQEAEHKFTASRRPPPFMRTVAGYLLMLEHCADPAKDFIDFKPGTSPDEIEALRKRAETAEAQLKDAECSVTKYARASERAKARISELETLIDTYAPVVTQEGKPVLDSFGNVLRRDFRFSTEAAEARVRELEALIDRVSVASGWLPVENREQATDTICKRIARTDAVVAELEAQNARLREALTDSSAMLWNVMHNGMMVPAARRSQLEQIEATIKAALADGKAAPS